MAHYDIDQLRESVVKILNAERKVIAGSGFIIRADGYLVTCHHVIYCLAALFVEYQGQLYEAQWCEEYSNPEVDVAILKIDVSDAKAVPIIHSYELSTSVTVYGFPESKIRHFPEGYDVSVDHIQQSASINPLELYPIDASKGLEKLPQRQKWNRLPQGHFTFKTYRLDKVVAPGTSGGPVFANDLHGVVGIIQCSNVDYEKGESYAIHWNNIAEELDKLDLEPRKNAICRFLEDIEHTLNAIKLFHMPKKIPLKDQYIPIEITCERHYRFGGERFGSLAGLSEEEYSRAYAWKGMGEEKRPQIPWKQAKQKHQQLLILADPGMGKTALLKMEAVMIALEGKNSSLWKGQAWISHVILPLFFRLSDFVKPDEEIYDAIFRLLKRNYPDTAPPILPLVVEKLRQGNCLLLLDALDEVPKEQREVLSDKLNRFANQDRTRACPIIVTSRIVGYGGNILDDAKEVEIVPFSPEQTNRYIETWFTNAADNLTDKSASAKGLIHELKQKPQIRGLAQNPLLLSLMCSLYQQKKIDFPTRRVQIYDKALNCMLQDWRQRKKAITSGEYQAKMRLLEKLAYHLSCKQKEIFSIDELYDYIEGYLKSGEASTVFRDSSSDELITEFSEIDGIVQDLGREGEDYIFLHKTFQEYLTASYLKRQGENGLEIIKTRFWEYDWHETIILFAGLMDDPIPIFKAITDEKDDIFSTLLLLAGRCLVECKTKTHALSIKIISNIFLFWKSYRSLDFVRSTLIMLGKMQHLEIMGLLTAFQDEDKAIRRAATAVLEEIGGTWAIEGLLTALQDEDEDVREAAVGALGELGDGRAVEGVLTALQDKDENVRTTAAMALGELGDGRAVEELLTTLLDEDEDGYVRWTAGEALGKLGDVRAIEGLLIALQDEDVREAAVEALGKLGDGQAVEGLLIALQDKDKNVRKAAARALGELGDGRAVGGLLTTALRDENWTIKKVAVEALVKLGDGRTIEGLLTALQDEDEDVREVAVRILGELGDGRAVEGVLTALQDKDENVRTMAARALGELGDGRALPAFQDEDEDVKEVAVEALGKLGDVQAVEGLLTALHNEGKYVRWTAVKALGELGNVRAVKGLLATFLRDKDWIVKRADVDGLGELGNGRTIERLLTGLHDENEVTKKVAAEALGKLGDTRAVEGLLIALQDKNKNVRKAAAWALGELGDVRAVEGLLTALQDEGEDVRWVAVRTLEKLGDTRAVEGLLTALQDEDMHVRWAAVWALEKLGDTQAIEGLLTALQDEDENKVVRETAARALGKLGDVRAVEGLLVALQDDDKEVRTTAVKALGGLGNVQAIEGLLAAEDKPVRWAAVDTLVGLEDERAIEGLLAALQGEDEVVIKVATRFLKRVGTLKTLKQIITLPNINIYNEDIFSLARTLATRFSKDDTSFIPVYPKLLDNKPPEFRIRPDLCSSKDGWVDIADTEK